MIYLDAAATTKIEPTVAEEIQHFLYYDWVNPSALYKDAVRVRGIVNCSRAVVAEFIHADTNEIIFTSGGSESNCTAIQGFVNKCRREKKHAAVITTRIEHKSVLLCAEETAEDFSFVDVDKDGFVDLIMLERIMQQKRDREILVSVQFANNEIGTIQHIQDISALVHTYGGVFHTDAVQAFGHVDLNVKELGIDLLSASGHKLGAPKGIGFLYKKKGVEISPIIYGTQENGLRGGTENVPYIAALAKAVLLRKENMTEGTLKITILRDNLLSELLALGCTVNGSLEYRLPNNISVTFPSSVTGEGLIYLLDTSGICIAAGSACNSHSQSASHVLKAIGLSDLDAMRTIRITLPDDFSADDIDIFIGELKKAIRIMGVGKIE